MLIVICVGHTLSSVEGVVGGADEAVGRVEHAGQVGVGDPTTPLGGAVAG